MRLKGKNMKHKIEKMNSNENGLKKVKLSELKPHPQNVILHPDMEDEIEIERLKNSILQQGLIHPICCKEENGKYIILSGNLRYKALMSLVNGGHQQFSEVYVKIVSFDNEKDELEYLLDANAISRRKTDYAKMMYVSAYQKMYDEKKERNELNVGISEQAYISEKMGISKRQVCKFIYIRNNLDNSLIKEIIDGNKMSLNKLYQRMKDLELQDIRLDRKDVKDQLITANQADREFKLTVKTKKTLQKVSKDLERLDGSTMSLLECSELDPSLKKLIKRLSKTINDAKEEVASIELAQEKVDE